MFSFITGIVEQKENNIAVINCNGVGFELNVSETTIYELPKIGELATIHTYMAVREDAITLFGFATKDEKAAFLKLISVSGIGGKVAITILSAMPVADLINAIITENVKLLSSVKGLGKKTAERIILELRDKVSADMAVPAGAKAFAKNITPTLPRTGNLAEAAEALMVLGYDKNSVAKALDGLDPKCDVGELVRLALKTFAK